MGMATCFIIHPRAYVITRQVVDKLKPAASHDPLMFLGQAALPFVHHTIVSRMLILGEGLVCARARCWLVLMVKSFCLGQKYLFRLLLLTRSLIMLMLSVLNIWQWPKRTFLIIDIHLFYLCLL